MCSINATINDVENNYTDFMNDSSQYYWYGGKNFEAFSESYGSIHKPLVLVISLFGVLANSVNIVVLTRRDMVTPTNILLTGLSVAQLLLLLSYLSLVVYNFLREKCVVLGKFFFFFVA